MPVTPTEYSWIDSRGFELDCLSSDRPIIHHAGGVAGMGRAGHSVNPYSEQDSKPRLSDLLALITPTQKRTYRNVSRSIKRLPGVRSKLNFYGKEWGWALRYSRGDATLCTLHFLPSKLEATLTVTRKLEDWGLGPNHLSPATKRSLRSISISPPTKLLRISLGSSYKAADLVRMVRFKVRCRQGPERRGETAAERIVKAPSRPSGHASPAAGPGLSA